MSKIPKTAHDILCDALGVTDGNIASINSEELSIGFEHFCHQGTGDPILFRDTRETEEATYSLVGSRTDGVFVFKRGSSGTSAVRDYTIDELKHLVCERKQERRN